MTIAMLSAVLAASALAAAAGSGNEAQDFESLDANGDGRIALHEVWPDPPVERRFEFADLDHNGTLDPWEYHALVTRLAGKKKNEHSPTADGLRASASGLASLAPRGIRRPPAHY